MEMDFGPIFELIADFDDSDLMERLRAMEGQLRPEPFSRLVSSYSYIGAVQNILDRAEEDGERSEQILDEIREMLQRLRSNVVADLQQIRSAFEDLRLQLIANGLLAESAKAQAAADQIEAMQRSQRVALDELPKLDELYGTLLSPLVFNRSKESNESP